MYDVRPFNIEPILSLMCIAKLESSEIIVSEINDGVSLVLCSKNCQATLRIARSTISSTSKVGMKIDGDQTSGITFSADFSHSDVFVWRVCFVGD